MQNYSQEDAIVSEQSAIEFGSEFGDLEMDGVLASIKEAGFAPVWVIRTGGTVNIGFGLVHKGVLYFGACDHIFYAVDAEAGKELWRFRTGDVILSKPCIAGDTIFFGSFDENLYALDFNGRLKWRFPAKSKISCAIKHAEGRLFFGTEDGNFFCLSAGGELLWSFSARDSIVEGAAIGDNIIVFGSWDRNVYALDSNGGMLWKFSTCAEVNVEPAIDGNVVYVGSADKNLYALELETGRMLWSFMVEGGVRGVTVLEDVILLVGYTEQLYAIDKRGKLLWRFRTSGYSVEPPAVSNGVIYHGCVDSNVYALDMKGAGLWRFATGSMVVCTPVVWNGKVYFGSFDCNVYCLDMKGQLIWKFPTSRSDISKIDVEDLRRERRMKFTLKPQEITMEKDSYKTDAVHRGDFGQYSAETGYAFSISKYQKGMGKYGK